MAAFYRSVHVGGETGIPPQPNPDFIFFKAQKGQQLAFFEISGGGGGLTRDTTDGFGG